MSQRAVVHTDSINIAIYDIVYARIRQTKSSIKVFPNTPFANRVSEKYYVYNLCTSHIVEINMFFIRRSSLVGWMHCHLPFSGTFANMWMSFCVFVFFSSLSNNKPTLTDQIWTRGWMPWILSVHRLDKGSSLRASLNTLCKNIHTY